MGVFRRLDYTCRSNISLIMLWCTRDDFSSEWFVTLTCVLLSLFAVPFKSVTLEGVPPLHPRPPKGSSSPLTRTPHLVSPFPYHRIWTLRTTDVASVPVRLPTVTSSSPMYPTPSLNSSGSDLSSQNTRSSWYLKWDILTLGVFPDSTSLKVMSYL